MRSRIVFAVVSLVAAAACEKEKPIEPARIRPVRVTKVVSTGGARTRKLSGTSQSGATSALSFRVAGTVVEIAVKVGDKVDAGQLIARVDPKDYQLQVQEALAALTQARAQERNAKSSYDRVRALWENKNASKGELDTARAAYETGRAAAASVAKRLELARHQLDYCTLKAPSSGAIANVRAEVNENVGAGTPIVTLSAGGRPEVRIEVPEALIADITPNKKVTVLFDSVEGQRFDGTVTEVGVAPVSGATTFPVTVRLDEDASAVRPGLAAEVELKFGSTSATPRQIVPPFAVQSDAEGPFVFIAEPGDPGKVVLRRVEVGELTTDGLEVKKGLSDGDLLVTAGVTKLKDGQQVRVPEMD